SPLSARSNRLANALLAREAGVMEVNAPPELASEARRIRQSALTVSPGELFSLAELEQLLGTLNAVIADPQGSAKPLGSEKLRNLQDRRGRLLGLVEAHPLLSRLSAATASLTEAALQLEAIGISERRLLLSTRFAPLAGSQLANFAGFLDRPFREFDYYAG